MKLTEALETTLVGLLSPGDETWPSSHRNPISRFLLVTTSLMTLLTSCSPHSSSPPTSKSPKASQSKAQLGAATAETLLFANSEVFPEFFKLSCETLSEMKIRQAQCLGAKGDGFTDDTAIFQGHLSKNNGELLLIPEGVYIISSPLFAQSPAILGRNAVLKFSDQAGPGLSHMLRVHYGATIQSVQFDANYRATQGLVTYKSHLSNFQNLKVSHSQGVGVHFDYTHLTRVENLVSEENLADGVWVESGNGMLFDNLTSQRNAGAGLVSAATTSSTDLPTSGGFQLQGGKIVENKQEAIRLDSTNSITLVKGMEFDAYADRPSLRMSGTSNAHIIENRFLSKEKRVDAPFITMDEKTMNNHVVNNTFEDETGDEPFNGLGPEIALSLARNHWVIGNLKKRLALVDPARVTGINRNTVIQGSLADFFTVIRNHYPVVSTPPSLAFLLAPPKHPSWKKGDMIFATEPSDTTAGWICEKSDQSGDCTWKLF